MKLRQRSAVALVTVASTLGVAGCSTFSPAVVLRPYDPSDGKNATVADVQVRNALVVASALDEPGVVSVTLVNSSIEEASVTVSADVDAAGVDAAQAPSQTFVIPAGQLVQIGAPAAVATASPAATADGPDEQQPAWMQIPQVPVHAGETLPLTFQSAGETIEVEAPVLLPCFAYAPLTPTAAPDPGAETAASADVECGPELGEEGLIGQGGEGAAH
ncbi:hypothetical protein [Kineococcus arenarius]|uniref:hypothetical protein n=1 Tax=Kineococcus sp. SYSU DK007 TaxID=3383128 RepID=UPI003D7D0CD4